MLRTLTVLDMTCHSCVATVSNAVRQVSGVTDVSVDLAAGTVQVAAPETVATDAIAAAITDAGYTVADADASPAVGAACTVAGAGGCCA
jgi:copper chaperone CopZ